MNREILDCSGAVGEGIVLANMNRYNGMMSRICVVNDSDVVCLDGEEGAVEKMDYALLEEEIRKDEALWHSMVTAEKECRDEKKIEYGRLCRERKTLIE